MKNKDKYKKFFSEYEMYDEDAPWHDAVCRGKECKGCIKRFIEWSEQETLPDLTGLEEEVLRSVAPAFKYIVRDQDRRLFLYYSKPYKKDESWISAYPRTRLPLIRLFDWICPEDAEPWCIDDLVKR